MTGVCQAAWSHPCIALFTNCSTHCAHPRYQRQSLLEYCLQYVRAMYRAMTQRPQYNEVLSDGIRDKVARVARSREPHVRRNFKRGIFVKKISVPASAYRDAGGQLTPEEREELV